MKSEPPTESLRHLLPKAVETKPGRGRAEDEFVPHYVDLPVRRQPAGVRNIRWGISALFFAMVLLGVAVSVSGARAVLPMLTCLLAFTLLWVLARLHVFHERNGVFLAVGLVCLFGALVPLCERAFLAIGSRAMVNLDPATPASAPTAAASKSGAPPAEDALPLLSEEFGAAGPDTSAGPHVKVLRDSRVVVDRKPYLIRAGEVFELDEVKDGDAVFLVKDMRLSLPATAVEISDPNPLRRSRGAAESAPPLAAAAPAGAQGGSAARVTQRSQEEAVRKYPALARRDSPENQLFIQTFRDLKNSGSELLDDPEWPLLVADLLAKRDWGRNDNSGDSAPPPKPDAEMEAESQRTDPPAEPPQVNER